MSSALFRRPGSYFSVAACLLLSAVFAMNVFRAVSQSITHDEALTYRDFVAAPFRHLVTHFSANNHLVNSLACRLTTSLLGISETTMRLPSLGGGLFYLVAVFLLCRYVFGEGVLFLAAVAVLSLNPFVLDYLSVARGYGLGLGFLLWAMYQLFRFVGDSGWEPGGTLCRKRLVRGAVCLALAVHSNLTFLLIALSLTITFVGMVVRTGRAELTPGGFAHLLRTLRTDFLRPFLLVFGVLAVALVKVRRGAFYVGEESLAESLRGITEASLAHHPVTWPWDTSSMMFHRLIGVLSTWGIGLVLLVTAIVWAKTMMRWMHGSGKAAALSRDDRFLLFSGGSLLLSCALVVGLHVALGVKYPHERTGIYLVPAFFFAGLAVVQHVFRQTSTRVFLGVPGFLLLWMLIWQFALQFPATYYRQWRYDCTSREVFETVAENHDPSTDAAVRVVCHWLYKPSLDFYRAARQASWLELVDARQNKAPYDFGVFPRQLLPADERWTAIFESEESDTVVAVPAVGRQRSTQGYTAGVLGSRGMLADGKLSPPEYRVEGLKDEPSSLRSPSARPLPVLRPAKSLRPTDGLCGEKATPAGSGDQRLKHCETPSCAEVVQTPRGES